MSIDELIRVLLSPDPDLVAITRVLGGKEIERQEGAGRRYALNDGKFASAFVGTDESAGGATPRYIELKTRDDAAVDVAELAKVYGEWRRVPATERRPHEIVFIRQGAGDYRVAIYATLSDDPEAPDARAQRLMLVREGKP